MQTRSSVLDRRRGAAATEFLIAFPTFLLFTMFILEMALHWADRHVLRLATYEAARTLVQTDTKERRENGGNVCWPESPTTPEERQAREKILGAAKAAATRKMAIVSPSVTMFATGLPLLNGAGAAIVRALDQVQGALPGGNSRIVKSFKSYVLSLPTAWALTRPTRCTEDEESVTVELTYYRAPKMPYIGGLLWAMRVGKLVNRGTGGIVELDIDNLDHFSVTPGLNQSVAIQRINEVRDALKDAVEVARNMEWESFAAGANPFAQVPGLSELDPIFRDGGMIDQAADALIGELGHLNSLLASTTSATTALVHAMPESLRLIPMRVEVRLAKDVPTIERENERWRGKAFLIAPFYNPSTDDDPWVRWAHNMQKDHVGLDTGAASVETR